MVCISVIIPYFQKDGGVLRRALNSVLSQAVSGDTHLRVIVVDDESPASVEAEIAGLTFEKKFALEVVRQPNGGCAAARNRGLSRVGGESDYIAFLDSDDYWKPDHIAKAVGALSRGYDFYFTDHARAGHHASHFAEINFPPKDVPPSALRRVDGQIWDIDKNVFFSFFLRNYVPQISGVVYRRAIAPGARFNAALQVSGEDWLFLLKLVAASKNVCFNSGVLSTCGDGVNIYFSKYSWGDEGHLERHMGELLAAYAMRKELLLSGPDEAYMCWRIDECRKRVAFFTLRWFLKTMQPWSSRLKAMVASDPGFLKWYLVCLLYVGILFPLKRYRLIEGKG